MVLPTCKIALIIPCLNEEVTIAKVINDFRQEFSAIDIYVIDNGSTDKTADIARREGAVVLHESRKGKGHAVRRAFGKIDADIYIMVDGDDTYDPKASTDMVARLIEEQLDMVVGIRKHDNDKAYRAGHEIGNHLFNKLFQILFGNQFTDIFSGYRVFSHAFVKSFPARSGGFEIETELSVHSANLHLATCEMETYYKERPEGSDSKLNTYIDGLRILRKMIHLLRQNKPMFFYGIFSVLALLGALLLGVPVILTYLETGLVPRFPSLIVSIGGLIVSLLIFMTGTILQTMLSFQAENRHLAYLAVKSKG